MVSGSVSRFDMPQDHPKNWVSSRRPNKKKKRCKVKYESNLPIVPLDQDTKIDLQDCIPDMPSP